MHPGAFSVIIVILVFYFVLSFVFCILYYKFIIMKTINKILSVLLNSLKKVLNIIWIISLKNIFCWLCSAWKWAWSKTTVDEKAAEVAKETIDRAKAVGKELKDVADAIGEVGNQIGDIPDALAGKKRKGRKPKTYKNNGAEKKKK